MKRRVCKMVRVMHARARVARLAERACVGDGGVGGGVEGREVEVKDCLQQPKMVHQILPLTLQYPIVVSSCNSCATI